MHQDPRRSVIKCKYGSIYSKPTCGGLYLKKNNIIFKVQSSHRVVSFPDYFSTHGGGNSLANDFCSLWFKNWWCSIFLYYVTSRKAWKYDKTVKRQLIAEIIGAWNLCQSQRDPKTILLENWSAGTSHCQLATSETHITRSQKSWHFTGLLSGSAWLSLLHSTSTV